MRIFEENLQIVADETGVPVKKSTWERRFEDSLSDMPEDIKFAPKKKGLFLGVVARDGKLWIYDLTNFQNVKKQPVQVCQNPATPLTCMSWNKNIFDKDMVMVGTKTSETADTSTMLLCSTRKENAQWTVLHDMRFSNKGHRKSVYDISWSALNGRSFHLLASCGKEGIFVWKFRFNDENAGVELLSITTLGSDSHELHVPVLVSWNLMVGSLFDNSFSPLSLLPLSATL